MVYSLNNLLVSVYVTMATELRARGWNVFWHASGETEVFTGGTEQGTVSLIQNIPANPTFITERTTVNLANADQIVLPAFAIDVQPPKRLRRLGLGHVEWEREATIRLGGIVTSSAEQRALASDLYDWLLIGDDDYYMAISDYDSNPSTPPALAPAEVWWANIVTPEVSTGVDAIRYQINAELILRYVE